MKRGCFPKGLFLLSSLIYMFSIQFVFIINMKFVLLS